MQVEIRGLAEGYLDNSYQPTDDPRPHHCCNWCDSPDHPHQIVGGRPRYSCGYTPTRHPSDQEQEETTRAQLIEYQRMKEHRKARYIAKVMGRAEAQKAKAEADRKPQRRK